MPTSLITPVEDRKRLARRLAGSGRGFAEQYGFRVTNNPASLFQVLYLAVLLGRRGDFRRALDGARAVRDEGWDSAARLARSLHEDRVRVLRASGQRGDVGALAACWVTWRGWWSSGTGAICAGCGRWRSTIPVRERALLARASRRRRSGRRPVSPRGAGAVAGGGPGRRPAGVGGCPSARAGQVGGRPGRSGQRRVGAVGLAGGGAGAGRPGAPVRGGEWSAVTCPGPHFAKF